MDSTKAIYLTALYITNEESRNTPLQQAFGQNQVVSGGAWKSRLAQPTDSGLWTLLLTDSGMQAIAAVTDLRDLRLAGTAVTGRSLEALKPLAKLQRLYLEGCRTR